MLAWEFSSSLTGGAQAHDLAWAAGQAAKMLTDNAATINGAISGLSQQQAILMLAASWNTGAGGQIERYKAGNGPDFRTAPIGSTGRYRNDYGSNILALMDCFQ